MAGDSPKTILVVDDERDLLDLVASILEGEGYRVQMAANGREALNQVGPYTLPWGPSVLLDPRPARPYNRQRSA